MAEDKKIVQAPCSQCLRKTKHEVLFETSLQTEETHETYVMMSCGGCSAISMGRQRLWIPDGDMDHSYYPSPVTRKMPTWMFLWSLGLGKAKGDAAIGAFDMKLDAFQNGGSISAIQRDAMRATLDVGDAAMHRAFLPSEQDLTLALDIIEGVLAPIYDHRTEAEKMADRVPPRAPKKP